jgi:pimeloyl-ACP methyl ester carboxylesterase
MPELGFQHFDILAHDRDARVAHRVAMDHPQTVRRLLLVDIAPTPHQLFRRTLAGRQGTVNLKSAARVAPMTLATIGAAIAGCGQMPAASQGADAQSAATRSGM